MDLLHRSNVLVPIRLGDLQIVRGCTVHSLATLRPSIPIVPSLSLDSFSMFSCHFDPHFPIVFQLEIS
jgi:hypothetical protein